MGDDGTAGAGGDAPAATENGSEPVLAVGVDVHAAAPKDEDVAAAIGDSERSEEPVAALKGAEVATPPDDSGAAGQGDAVEVPAVGCGEVAAATDATGLGAATDDADRGGVVRCKGRGSGREKVRGRGRFPSLLTELNLKMTPRGIQVPESRKMVLTRRREQREMGMLVDTRPPEVLALADAERQKKKRKKDVRPGVTLDELQSDLFHAAFSGNCDACCDAVAAGVDLNVQTKADTDGIGSGGTALHVAAVRGHVSVVAALIGAKADPTILSNRKESPLDLALRGGHVEVVEVLTDAGAGPGDTESAMRLMRQAPSWDQGRKRGQLRSALTAGGGGKGRTAVRREIFGADSRVNRDNIADNAEDRMDVKHEDKDWDTRPDQRRTRFARTRPDSGKGRKDGKGKRKSGKADGKGQRNEYDH